MDEIHWLHLSNDKKHPYRIVLSKRAKYVRIKLSSHGDLSVVAPCGVQTRHAHEFLLSRADWVEKHLKDLPEKKPAQCPDELTLQLLNERWTIDYIRTEAPDIRLQESAQGRLSILGNTTDPGLVRQVILMWCKQKAGKILNPMLQQCAEKYGFHYRRLSIRAQKTRWGSCSSQKNINLNCKLLFFPEHIVRYVMIHELCHTIEMNHSARFWSLVEECDPDYKIHRTNLKSDSRKIFVNAFWH